MKYYLGTAILAAAVTVAGPAYGQQGAISGLPLSPQPANITMLPHYPEPSYGMIAVSGNLQEFEPSLFMPFKSAVARGAAYSNAPRKTVVEAAMATRAEQKEKAKVLLTQDNSGNAIVVRVK